MEIELKVKDIYQPLQGVIGVVEKDKHFQSYLMY